MLNELPVIVNAKIGLRHLAEILHAYLAQSCAATSAAQACVRNQPVIPWT